MSRRGGTLWAETAFQGKPFSCVVLQPHPGARDRSLNMPDPDRIVAVGLLTDKEMQTFGADLKLVYPIPTDGSFDELLAEIERVSAETRPDRDGRRSH